MAARHRQAGEQSAGDPGTGDVQRAARGLLVSVAVGCGGRLDAQLAGVGRRRKGRVDVRRDGSDDGGARGEHVVLRLRGWREALPVRQVGREGGRTEEKRRGRVRPIRRGGTYYPTSDSMRLLDLYDDGLGAPITPEDEGRAGSLLSGGELVMRRLTRTQQSTLFQRSLSTLIYC